MRYTITSVARDYQATLSPEELYAVISEKLPEGPLCIHNQDLGIYVDIDIDDDIQEKVEEVSGEAPFGRTADIVVLAVCIAFVVGIIGATVWT